MSKPWRMVIVTWVDSCGLEGWTFPRDAEAWADGLMTIHSAGFVFRETKELLTLCLSYDHQEDPNVNGLFQIPKCSIKKIKTVMELDK
jgi:hypothetical protein